MKGVVFNLLETVVVRHWGADAWDDLLDAAGLDGAYTSLGSYDDAELERLVSAACVALSLERAQVLRWFGREAMGDLSGIYPDFFTPHVTSRAFLATLNNIIHPEVRKLYAGAACPHFRFAEEGEALVMEYHSPRRLCALAHGFVEGAAAHYGETVNFVQDRCVEQGADSCLFRIRWPAQLAA